VGSSGRSLRPQGTLTPIVKVPSQAIPTERCRNAIRALAADPKNVVYLISGRDGDFLEEHWSMVDLLGLSAEHGSFVKRPGDEEFVNMTETLDMSWMSEVEEIFKYYQEVRAASRFTI
jgi:trehalose 6-phosphate synthase/phosphatase